MQGKYNFVFKILDTTFDFQYNSKTYQSYKRWKVTRLYCGGSDGTNTLSPKNLKQVLEMSREFHLRKQTEPINCELTGTLKPLIFDLGKFADTVNFGASSLKHRCCPILLPPQTNLVHNANFPWIRLADTTNTWAFLLDGFSTAAELNPHRICTSFGEVKTRPAGAQRWNGGSSSGISHSRRRKGRIFKST